MKKISILLLILPFILSAQKADVYLDQAGQEIDYKEYRNLQETYTSWVRLDKKKKISQISNAKRLEPFSGDYMAIKYEIEQITNKTFPDNTVFIIEYRIVNDLCGGQKDPNNWTRRETMEWKKQVQPRIKHVEKNYENTVVLYLFENGISLNENIRKEKIFFLDTKNILKLALFKFPAYCGHHAIIKPDNKILVINGESAPGYVAQYSIPENWKLLFPESSEKLTGDSQ